MFINANKVAFLFDYWNCRIVYYWQGQKLPLFPPFLLWGVEDDWDFPDAYGECDLTEC
jgi:hypothetical protein